MKYIIGHDYSLQKVAPKLDDADKLLMKQYLEFELQKKDLSWFAITKQDGDELVIYVYATIANSTVNNKRKTELAYVIRNNCRLVSSRLRYTHLAGYRYDFHGKKHSRSYMYYYYPYAGDEELRYTAVDTDVDYKMSISKFIGLDGYSLNYKPWKHTSDKYKYIDFSFLSRYTHFCATFSALSTVANIFKNIMEHTHDCEMLIKSDCADYIYHDVIFKGNKAKWMKEVKLYKKYNVKFLDKKTLNFNIKYKGDPKHPYTSSDVKNFPIIAKKTKQPDDVIKAIMKYIKKSGTTSDEYLSFLEIREKAGLGVTDKAALFPRDFHATLKALEDTYGDAESIELNNKIEKTIITITTNHDFLTAFQPARVRDFQTIGNDLHNCVGWNRYDKKVAKRESMIVEILKCGKPYACVELKSKEFNNVNVEQLRMDKNEPCWDKEVINFVNQQIIPQVNPFFFPNGAPVAI